MITPAELMLIAVIICLLIVGGVMFKSLCLAYRGMCEYKDLLQYIVDRHEFMPTSLLREIQKFEK